MGDTRKDLVQIIRDNPGCIATIDNDCWWLERNVTPPSDFDNWTDNARDDWFQHNRIAHSRERFLPLDDGEFGSGNCYGGDILLALAKIVGIKVQSV